MCKNHNHQHAYKISKFGDFLLESKAAKLLLEGNLMASDKFLKKLSTMKDNPIASKIYTAFADKKFIDKDLAQNWVDISDKDDVVTFMSDRGALRVDPELSNGVFTAKGRNEIKVGRFARAILTELGEKVLDKDIEVFVNSYKASKEDTSKGFKLVSGPEIKKYYSEKQYADSRKGTLGDSCMRYDNCQKYFKIYTKNPEQCQLLVYTDDNDKVLGRAIVWKLTEKELYNPEGQTQFECPAVYFMDRVYTGNDSDVVRFTNFAKEKGWLYKWKMNADDKDGLFFRFNDKIIFGRITVELTKATFRKYPFVDTLNFCDENTNRISNVSPTIEDPDDDDLERIIQMNDTGGDCDNCDDCIGTGYDDEVSDNCRKCDGDGKVDCMECRGSGNEICKKFDGDGDIKCTKCDGDGDYNCPDCSGRGSLTCVSCNGQGSTDCKECEGKGNTGKCPDCKGEGDFDCPDCKDGILTCRVCNGAKKITRAWGKGKRVVNCPGCNGEGEGRGGSINRTKGKSEEGQGCRCKCADAGYSAWCNTGRLKCENCDGDGVMLCPSCKDDDSGSAGKIECKDCHGNGRMACKKCNYGTIHCKVCDGNGTTGKCPDCKGKGNIGKCKNDKCKNGDVKCTACVGSGKKPEGFKNELCPNCAGLLDEMKDDLRSGNYKIR